MADFDKAAGDVAEARDEVATCETNLTIVAGEVARIGHAIGDMPETLDQVVSGLDTLIGHLAKAKDAADEASTHTAAADESAHFGEATNAIQLLEEAGTQAQGSHVNLVETKTDLIDAVEKIRTAVNTMRVVLGSMDVGTQSTKNAEDNLRQLAERLG